MDNTIIEQLKVISEEFEHNARPIPQAVIDETIKILKATSDRRAITYKDYPKLFEAFDKATNQQLLHGEISDILTALENNGFKLSR